MLSFLWIFVWPFVLPVLCIGVLSRVRRERLVLAAGLFLLLGMLTAAPLAYSVVTSPYNEGLAVGSLSLYPVSLIAIIGTLLIRGLIIRRKGVLVKADGR